MKPIDVKSDYFAEYNDESNEKYPKFKAGDHVRISKYKNIFVKGYTPNWSEEIFVIKKIKNTVPWIYMISNLNGEETVGRFYEKELQKTNKKEFRFEKIIKRKGDKLYAKWKGHYNSFNGWIHKKDLIKSVSQYFSPYRSSGRYIQVKLDLSSYAAKSDLKNITHVHGSVFTSKINLASLKTKVNKLDIDKLTPVPNDLTKLSSVVNNDVVKKTEYNKLVTKVDNIDTIGFVLKTKYDADKSDLEKNISDTEKRIPDTSGLVKKTDYSSKITEIENT